MAITVRKLDLHLLIIIETVMFAEHLAFFCIPCKVYKFPDSIGLRLFGKNMKFFTSGDGDHGIGENPLVHLIVGIVTLWLFNIANWKITIFNGTIHNKWPFSIAMLNYQRVTIMVHQLCRTQYRVGCLGRTLNRKVQVFPRVARSLQILQVPPKTLTLKILDLQGLTVMVIYQL